MEVGWGRGGGGKKRRCWIFLWSERLTLSCKLPRSVRGLGGEMEIGATGVRSAFPNLLSVYLTPIATLSTAAGSEKVGRFLKRHESSSSRGGYDRSISNRFETTPQRFPLSIFEFRILERRKWKFSSNRIAASFTLKAFSIFPLVNSPLVAPRFIAIHRLFHPRIPISRKRTSCMHLSLSLSSFPFLPTRLAFARNR